METSSPVFFVIGSPGAGKGTLCKKLATDHGIKHVSVGDLLRQIIQSPNADSTVVEYVRRAELLPTETLFSVLKPLLMLPGQQGPAHRTLLDGFPRQLDQAKLFEKELGQPELVLFFDCPEDIAEDRVVKRMVGREGDNQETFRRRYKEFSELNPPIIEYYKSQGKLIQINSSGATDSSYAQLLAALENRPEWGL